MRRRGPPCSLPGLLATGCTGPAEREVEPPLRSAPASSPTDSPGARTTPPDGRPRTRPRPDVRPRDFDPGQADAVVRHLAGTIGPRHGTSPAFRAAVTWVGRLLRAARLPRPPPVVRRARAGCRGACRCRRAVGQRRRDPARVRPAAAAPRRRRPPRHRAAGAGRRGQRLGRRRGARGRGRRCAKRRTRLPVVWVAFGAEEPRGPTDDDHHYGSRAYVAAMTPAERRALRGMVSLDRVGVGARRAGRVGGGLRPGAAVAAGRPPGVPGCRRTVTGPAQQRPLVLRPGRAAGCPPRHHAVRRLPLAAGRPGRRRPGPARAHRPAACWPGWRRRR